MCNSQYFKGRKAVIATKHGKETVIGPLLEKEIGINYILIKGLDTDLLGTFSGEVERMDDPVTIMRKKCEMAIAASGLDLAIANEGSFGAHPSVFFAHADDELIMLLDKKNNLEIIERELSIETNFDGKEVKNVEELVSFAQQVGFPSHGIILKKSKNNFSVIIKESSTIDELIEHYHSIKNTDNTAYAETDMRAMKNPTRMKIIEKATAKLINKIKSECPQCKTPGFSVTDVVKGLACEACGLPTKSTLKHIYSCQKCHFTTEKLYPFDKQKENPQYCDFCNP